MVRGTGELLVVMVERLPDPDDTGAVEFRPKRPAHKPPYPLSLQNYIRESDWSRGNWSMFDQTFLADGRAVTRWNWVPYVDPSTIPTIGAGGPLKVN